MKKCKRWIAVLLVSLMCLSLCGCQELEDMRAAHAVWQEDGSILWNGNVYRQLENVPEELHIYGDSVYVTEADVPVLLSDAFGEYFTASDDGVLLSTYMYEFGRVCYCREDMRDEMTEYLQQTAELNNYYYSYWSYENEDEECYYLTKAQNKVIGDLMANLDFVSVEAGFYTFYEEPEGFSLTMGKCDEKHLFNESYVLDIVFQNGKFYLTTPDNLVGEVPAEYKDAMRDIVKDYYEAEIKPFIE